MKDLVKDINSELINSSDLLIQYRDIRLQNEGYIVLFRLGEFYETYFDDACVLSQVCSINLTKRHFKFGDIYLAGFPSLKKPEYIKKLLDKGYKIALCEEFQENSDNKIKKRKVVRKYTQGVLLEEEFLNPDENNFLCAMQYKNNLAELSFSDVSTNQVYITSVKPEKVLDEILKFNPSEILLSSDCSCSKDLSSQISNICEDTKVTFLEKKYFTIDSEIASSDAYSSLNAIFSYTKNSTFECLINPCIVFYNAQNHLDLSYGALRNLEVLQNMQNLKKDGTLFWVLDKTRTPMGRRFLEYSLKFPLLSKNQIQERQNIIFYFLENKECWNFIEDNLALIGDVSRIIIRIKNNCFKFKDFLDLKNSVSAILRLVQKFNKLEIFSFSKNLLAELDVLENFLFNNISDDLFNPVNPLNNSEFQYLLSKINNTLALIENYEKELMGKTKIKNLKIVQTKNNKFVIEIPRSASNCVLNDFIYHQNLSNTTRYTTHKLDELSSEYILGLANKTSMIETLTRDISSYLTQYLGLFLNYADKIATFDMLFAFAQVAHEHNYICPKFKNNELSLKNAKHPSLSIKYPDFQPSSFEFTQNLPNFVLLTGANMAGKSTLMRQLALICVMAQAGSYVPASSADLPIFDKIFVRFGMLDNIFKNKSSFALEMHDVKQILDNATKNSLILLDELGKSTSTQDGSAIARAVSEYIFNFIGAKTIFATHYHNLKEMCTSYPSQVRPLVLSISQGSRIIQDGFLDKSYGIKIAEELGMPEYILERALNYASSCQ